MKNLLFSVALLLLATPLFAQPDFQVLSLRQLNHESPEQILLSTDVELKYFYSHTDNFPYYLNVFALNPQNQQSKWAVENLALHPFAGPRELVYLMPFFDLFTNNTPIPLVGLSIFISDTILLFPPPLSLTDFQPFTCSPYVINFGSIGGVADSLAQSVRTDTTVAPGNTWVKNDSTRSITRGCNVPNLDLDSTQNGPDSTYAGDWNACAPVGCANSMQWLESVYPTKISSGLTHREKLEELSKMMKRQARSGSTAENIVKGKLEFVDKHKLPIRVKYQHNWLRDSLIKSPDNSYGHEALNKNKNRATPNKNQISWEWIWNEMQHGEDVELWITTENPRTGSRIGSHIVTLTGMEETKGVRRLSYKDDVNQADTAGTREITFTVDSVNNGYLYLKERDRYDNNGRLTRRTYIEGAFSESYDSTVTFPSSINRINGEDFGYLVLNNPFTKGESVAVQLEKHEGHAREAIVYNTAGEIVAKLTGNDNTFVWNGNNNNNYEAAPGVYLIRITSSNLSVTVRVLKW
jgi:hypothetical protein